MKPTTLNILSLAAVLALASGAARAGGDDELGFHGYFRAGVGSSSAGSGGRQNCFGLGQTTMRYRLGNECDAYGEFFYTHEMAKTSDGASFNATLGFQEYTPNSSQNLGSEFGSDANGSTTDVGGTGYHFHIIKAYAEAKNLPFLNGGTAWIGQRQYRRPDIHILDLQYINLNGTGAGVDRVQAGPGKFSYALFKDNDTNVVTDGAVTNSDAAWRQNFIYEGIPTNTDGSLDVLTSLITPTGKGRKSGWQATLLHHQDKVLGGGNTVGLQYGVGPGAGAGCCDRMGASGSTTTGHDVTRTRLFDDLWIQATPQFSGEFVALVQRDRSHATGSSTWYSVGGRPVYAVSEHFKLQAELGYDTLKNDGQPTQHLAKLTIAPTLTVGQGFWSRPELRAFVTYGKWNGAATGAVNAANEAGKVFNSTSGTSYGVQLETWF